MRCDWNNGPLFIHLKMNFDCATLIANLTVRLGEFVLSFPPFSKDPFARPISATSDFYILNWLREIFHAFNTVICLFRTGFTVPETCWIKIFSWKRRGRRREKRFNVRPTFSEKIKIKISRSTWNDFHPFLENLEEKNVVSWAMNEVEGVRPRRE